MSLKCFDKHWRIVKSHNLIYKACSFRIYCTVHNDMGASLTVYAAEKLVYTFITCRLEYCNSVPAGCHNSSLKHYLFIYFAVHVLIEGKNRDHISLFLISLHLHPVLQQQHQQHEYFYICGTFHRIRIHKVLHKRKYINTSNKNIKN